MAKLNYEKSKEKASKQWHELYNSLDKKGIFQITSPNDFENALSKMFDLRRVDTGCEKDLYFDFDYKNLGCTVGWDFEIGRPILSGFVDYYDGNEDDWYSGEGIYQFDIV